MNVLRHQMEKIDEATYSFVITAKELKLAMTDAFFEDRVCIENVDAAFEIEKEAEEASNEIYRMRAKIVAENSDSVRLIYILKNKLQEIEAKTNALEKVLESL